MSAIKHLIFIVAAMLTFVGGAADVVLSDVKAVPRYPWNGLVDIDFTLQCEGEATLSLSATRDNGHETVAVRTFWLEDGGTRSDARPITVAQGNHRIVWDAGADLTNSISHGVEITLDAVVGSAKYLVVDLSGGPEAASWPVTYLPAPPAGGWGEEYKTDRMVFVLVSKGSFTMGSPETELGRDAANETQHAVTLTHSYYTAVFETTQYQYFLMTGSEPSYFDPLEDRPVDSVTWYEARDALATMQAKTGLEFRLPTEAEWEYACRGGTTSALYNGKELSDEYEDPDALDPIANTWSSGWCETISVGSLAPNEYKLCDMLGNVSEWCQDAFAPYASAAATDPCVENPSAKRVLRGGDCWSFAYACRSAARDCADPGDARMNVGFRAVVTGSSDGSASARENATVEVLDTRPSPRFVSVDSTHKITYSPKWKEGGKKCQITGTKSHGPTDLTGSMDWKATTADSWGFQFKIDGELLYTASFSVLPSGAIAENRSVIDANLTIPDGQTWVISSPLTIPADVTVTLAPGAVVKLTPGVKVTIEEGGRLVANGEDGKSVVITHVNDDTVGAIIKTDPDGKDRPTYGAYQIDGEIEQNDFTYFRYLAAQSLPAKISGETVLRRGRVYTAASTVTVLSGAKLTIQPGVVVKFGPNADLVVNGRLDAQGTPSENIVFTAMTDDNWGGDTDGDFGRVKPGLAAWGHIEVVGTATFRCCRVLYGSDATDEGAIHVVGGSVDFDDGEIAHCAYECVRVNNGMFNSNNSVFRESGIAFGYYSGLGVYVRNAVVAYITEVVRGANKHFHNTVFYRCIKFPNRSNGSCNHCVFFNPAGYEEQAADQWTGDGTNFWGDPKFVDNGLTPFAPGNGSSCIDAADGDESSEFDAFGRPRMTVLGEGSRRGTPDSSGNYPDVGVFEADGEAAEKPNLSVASVAVPNGAEVGETVTISYRVANDASADIPPGTVYRDIITFLSADGLSSIEAKSFDTNPGETGFPAGSEKTFEQQVQVPALLGGDWFVRVTVNALRSLSETSYNDNVLASSKPVNVQKTANSLSEPTTAAVSAGRPVSFKFVNDSDSRIVTVTAPEGATVRYGFGFMPSSQSSSGSVVVGKDGEAVVSLPPGKTVYIVVESDREGAVKVQPNKAEMRIRAVNPPAVAPAVVTLALDGQLFGEDARVVVSNAAAAVPAQSVTWISSEQVIATCDFAAFDEGDKDFVIVDLTSGGVSVQAPVTILRTAEDPQLEVLLDMPDSLRQGSTFTIPVSYRNTGSSDMPAPIIRIISPNLVFRTPYGEYEGSVRLLALGAKGNEGVLSPGETYKMEVSATVKTDPGSSGQVVYSVVSLTKYTAGADGRLPRSYFLADDADSEEAEAVAERLGATWSDFFDRFSGFVTARCAYGLAVTDFDVMANDYARHLLVESRAGTTDLADRYSRVVPCKGLKAGETGLEPVNWNERAYNSAESLRARTAANREVAGYTADSPKGTLWLRREDGSWVRLIREDSSPSKEYQSGNPIVLIAHGVLESVHASTVQKLAGEIAMAGLWPDLDRVNVIAVDWGASATRDATADERTAMNTAAAGSPDDFSWWNALSPALKERLGHAEFGFAAAWDLPAIATLVCEQLHVVCAAQNPFYPGKAVFIGWGHGAHLLGAVAAKCAEDSAIGKIGRLVLIEPSGAEQLVFTPPAGRYPQAWNGESADVIESYKTSSWASGAGTVKDSAQVFGQFNFNVVPETNAVGRLAFFDGSGIRANGGSGMPGYLYHADADNVEARNDRARSLDCVRWFVDTVHGCAEEPEKGGWSGIGWSWMSDGSPAKFALPHEGYFHALTNYPHAFHALIRERGRTVELTRPLVYENRDFYPWREN